MRPLGHRLQVVDRLRRLHLNGAHELPAAIGRGQHEIRKYLNLADADRDRLVFADIDGDLVTTLQFHLQQPDDAVVFELFADGPHQDWAHFSSGTRQYPESPVLRTVNFNAARAKVCSRGQIPKHPAA